MCSLWIEAGVYRLFHERDGQPHFLFVAADFIKAAYQKQPQG